MKTIRIIVLAAATLLFLSCTARKEIPVRIDAVRPPIPGTHIIETTVNRSEYGKSLRYQKALQRLRLVPILRSAQFSGEVPEYRLFDVQPLGPAHFLGLREADILIAANGYIIYDPEKFKTYLMLLQNEKTADIEIRRNGQHILYKYTFTD